MSRIINLIILLACASLMACDGSEPKVTHAGHGEKSQIVMDVYKTPTCGCCAVWVEHLQGEGFSANVHDQDSLDKLKASLGIAQKHQSCHTGISKSGHFFEGHIPAKIVRQFLKEPPEGAAGLAVPGMPLGSPGMEMGERFTPYQVLQINKDGSSQVYAEVANKEEQYAQ